MPLTIPRDKAPLIAAAVIYGVLLLPVVREALTSAMAAQMLVQIPLLAVIGWMMRPLVSNDVTAHSDWNWHGVTGLVLATFTAAYWMLPRSLDAAVDNPLAIAAKFITVPLLIGLPLGLSWPRMGFVLRGYVLSELIGMCFRLGWLYIASPVRLCSQYLIGDQQQTGWYLIGVGAGIFLWVGAWALFVGRRPTHVAAESSCAPDKQNRPDGTGSCRYLPTHVAESSHALSTIRTTFSHHRKHA